MASPAGLSYHPGIISSSLLTELEDYFSTTDEWAPISNSESSRRVIHFESVYSYGKGVETQAHPLPDVLNPLLKILKNLTPAGWNPDQIIVNEYLPGQGITPHIDDIKKFRDYVCCFTIGSGATMIFERSGESFSLYTEPGSLYIMSGESRWEWTHQLKKNKTDMVDGVRIKRGTRISITFRQWK